jgi:hypothetical protein
LIPVLCLVVQVLYEWVESLTGGAHVAVSQLLLPLDAPSRWLLLAKAMRRSRCRSQCCSCWRTLAEAMRYSHSPRPRLCVALVRTRRYLARPGSAPVRYSAQTRAAAPSPHVHAPPLDPATAPWPQLRGHVRRASRPVMCAAPFAAPWLRAPPPLLLPTRAALPRLPNLETRELGRSGFFILLEWDEPASTGNIPLLG